MSEEIRPTQMRNVQNEAFLLFKKKNKDYGDAFADFGPVGVLVRLGDKLRRFASISKSGVTLVQDEGLRDTLIDLHNYAAMAVMLMDEEGAILLEPASSSQTTEGFDCDSAFDFLSDPDPEESLRKSDQISQSLDAFNQLLQNGED
ncbi:DUF1599 domain-containing protein [Candidatus Bathyarchaeota archaeon]|mgnify:CR=1 FL=1|jgi:hypothetical protein|nr:DUF1599 domain-containing protein [Candidatus Bathyarchaeota archaeon]